ncbi:hypothetical protein [Paenibacillus silagei]|uniref:Uncharacterized protein n=1 Tax=Paenibacillus silagei TaxID=1670801 RepID=A0ABS4P2F5_9BACL|nr:hypothetical protein [Paenibacillus silagei]MBP2115926.1 hypothetical protein [Paenibacillus silagei]
MKAKCVGAMVEQRRAVLRCSCEGRDCGGRARSGGGRDCAGRAGAAVGGTA